MAGGSKGKNVQKLQQQVKHDRYCSLVTGVRWSMINTRNTCIHTDDRFEIEGEAVGDIEQSTEESNETFGHLYATKMLCVRLYSCYIRRVLE